VGNESIEVKKIDKACTGYYPRILKSAFEVQELAVSCI
jgi:hypothetical protein